MAMTFVTFVPRRAVRVVPLFAVLGGIVGSVASCSQSIGYGNKTPADIAADRPVTITHEDCDVNSAQAQKADSNSDGKVDIISVMSGGKEICRALDLNMDGRIDRYVYFDAAGQVRRVESDYDRDGRIDEVSNFKNGELIRKDREMNLDGKVDTWDVYEGGKLVRRERDSDGDGKVDQIWTWPDARRPGCAIVASDHDGDGKAESGFSIDMCASLKPGMAAAPSGIEVTPVKAVLPPDDAKPKAKPGAEAAPK